MFKRLTFFKIAQFLSLHLPLRMSYRLATLLADLHFLKSRNDRIAIMNNLRVIEPHLNKLELFKAAREVFRNFAKYLIDFLRFSILDRDYISKKVTIEGLEHIDRAFRHGKGVIALTAHLGNWELGAVVVGVLGYPIVVIALPHQDKEEDIFFNRQRELKGVEVVPVGRAVRYCLDSLRANKLVAIAGDRDFSESGLRFEFFGRQAFVPKGPAAFSLKTGSPIVCAFMIRLKGDNFKFVFEEPIWSRVTGDDEADLAYITSKFLKVLEKYIRRYPTQWFMFKEFWK